jgi:tetratricopeptide (TPR) repeat protein
MITDAIAAEKNGLWGRAYVDGSHNAAPGSQVGDKWLAAITDQLHKVGMPVAYDDAPSTFPDGYPMTDCALYYGWYAGQLTGPFTRSDFRFVQGAIAVHIHSFSASTLRDPNANWVAPLIARGATASIGNVYEPFLQLTPHLDIFNDRLLHGFTFAESAYMSVQALSWMSVIVGDPLYRPYAVWSQIETPRDSAKGASQWKMYHEFAVKNRSLSAPQYRVLARQVALGAHNAPMLEDLGSMEVQEGDFALAASYFQQARANYSKRDDILRVVLDEAECLIKQDRRKRALNLVRSVLRIVSEAPATPLLRKIEQDIAGSPTSPPTP